MEKSREKFLDEVNIFLGKKLLIQYRDLKTTTKFFSDLHLSLMEKNKKATFYRRLKYLFTGKI